MDAHNTSLTINLASDMQRPALEHAEHTQIAIDYLQIIFLNRERRRRTDQIKAYTTASNPNGRARY
jgi:hypothetical protein